MAEDALASRQTALEKMDVGVRPASPSPLHTNPIEESKGDSFLYWADERESRSVRSI